MTPLQLICNPSCPAVLNLEVAEAGLVQTQLLVGYCGQCALPTLQAAPGGRQ